MPKETAPKIPQETLNKFLAEKNVNVSSSNIVEGFLWKTGDIIRCRIDVWSKTGTTSSSIVASFFVHYNEKTKKITDKTLVAKLFENSKICD